MSIRSRMRYLVRASFLYGNFDNSNLYPKFDLSLGASPWSTIVIDDTITPVVEEAIILAAAPVLSVCLSNASTGQPFISTLELRQFNGSPYHTSDEKRFFLALSARINFGAESNESIRYPDDPFDRIWESDSVRRANFLMDIAPGTERTSTTKPVFVSSNDEPPEKVMQTAVVGHDGSLNYRLDLEGFPGNAGTPAFSEPFVDVKENAQGKYRLYEPGFTNVSLPFVFSFGFKKTDDSLKGPILNAMETYRYSPITMGSQDANTMANFVSRYSQARWAREGGDPCLPASWSWVQCSSEAAPSPRVSAIALSGMNITGSIPLDLTKLSGLVELRFDGNSFTGQFPDFSECHNLQYIHLENDLLTGKLPPYLGDLPNLKELYVQNNRLSGQVPQSLFKKNIILNFSGNRGLHIASNGISHTIFSICVVIGTIILLGAAIGCYLCISWTKKKPSDDTIAGTSGLGLSGVILWYKKYCGIMPWQRGSKNGPRIESFLQKQVTAHPKRYTYSQVRRMTTSFAHKLGKGGYGAVYRGNLPDGREIAVKMLKDAEGNGEDFMNEVASISRTSHVNVISLLGFCLQGTKRALIYEYMPNGSLERHCFGSNSSGDNPLTWDKLFHIAIGIARGLEYLHTRCNMRIVHFDIKPQNILLDQDFCPKISDFGLAKLCRQKESKISIVGLRGTAGYMAPEVCSGNYGRVSSKFDVYSYGMVVLEMVGARKQTEVSTDSSTKYFPEWPYDNLDQFCGATTCNCEISSEAMEIVRKMTIVGLWCIQGRPADRPSMSKVLEMLESNNMDLEMPPKAFYDC